MTDEIGYPRNQPNRSHMAFGAVLTYSAVRQSPHRDRIIDHVLPLSHLHAEPNLEKEL
jgi:hypothetical protein